MLREIIRPIQATWRPPYVKLALSDTVSNPIESHIYCFRPFQLDRIIGDARSAGIVGGDGGRWLGVSEFVKSNADWDGLARVVEERP